MDLVDRCPRGHALEGWHADNQTHTSAAVLVITVQTTHRGCSTHCMRRSRAHPGCRSGGPPCLPGTRCRRHGLSCRWLATPFHLSAARQGARSGAACSIPGSPVAPKQRQAQWLAQCIQLHTPPPQSNLNPTHQSCPHLAAGQSRPLPTAACQALPSSAPPARWTAGCGCAQKRWAAQVSRVGNWGTVNHAARLNRALVVAARQCRRGYAGNSL